IDTVKSELAQIKKLNSDLQNMYKTLQVLQENNLLEPETKQQRLAGIYNTAVLARKDILHLTTRLFGFYAGRSPTIAENAVRWQQSFDKAGSDISNLIHSLATSTSDDASNKAEATEKLEDYHHILNAITVGIKAASLELEAPQEPPRAVQPL
ncbi:MAG: hypothetical protein WBE18_05165, partial [Gammaproteobacteria bacterium]